MDSVKIILIRHGESIGNANKLFLGHTDLDLSERGYRQAKYAADYLVHNQKIDAIYSSDLLRAFNTVKTYGDIVGLEVIPSKQFREVNVGAWEGMHVDDIIAQYPKEFSDWVERFGTFKAVNGEAIMEAGKRFYDEVVRVSRINPGKTLLIGAHAAVIRAFWAIIAGVLPENISAQLPYATNASCSFLDYDGEKFIPGKYSYDEYIKESGDPIYF